ncbi:MAG: hypothetical protein CMJ78_27860 [Planctomycetaceae bacterium]|nr:hypothetical protein [Planctomycetaceae bacterium]
MAMFRIIIALLLIGVSVTSLLSQDKTDDATSPKQAKEPAETKPAEKTTDTNKTEGEKRKKPTGHVPLNSQGTVLMDPVGKRLLLKSKVCLQQGALEMLCCLDQTKEHESILTVNTKAYVVHTGLLALSAKPGSPVRYDPNEDKLYPASGQKIEIYLNYKDKEGTPHRVPAQSWIRHSIHRFYAFDLPQLPYGVEIPKRSELRYDDKHKEISWYGPMTKAQRENLLSLSQDRGYRSAIHKFYKLGLSRQMKANWVFAGSGFFVDESTGQRSYQAEGGDLICVANFSTAMIDVTEASSAEGTESLLYEAWTERLPPRDTEVLIELIPVFDSKDTAKGIPE